MPEQLCRPGGDVGPRDGGARGGLMALVPAPR